MNLLKLVTRNSMRHKLRSGLTALGLALAVMAFAVIRTAIDAWYLQSEIASPRRLVTRNAVSLVFPIPIAYKERIARLDGVTRVSNWSWFGAVYVDPKNFFANFAVDAPSMLAMYPEFTLSPEERQAFFSERSACIVGRKLADRFGWDVGDKVQLTGTIYPGAWDVVIRGIYNGRDPGTDETQMFFHYAYLDERLREEMPARAGRVGTIFIEIADANMSATISERVDSLFRNSLAETKTESEKAFQLGFVTMSGAIITGLRIVSYMVIAIILLVLGNTMVMTARERTREYAVLKTLGFQPRHLIGFILGESLFIATIGGLLGLALTYPGVHLLSVAMGDFFMIVSPTTLTIVLGGLAAIMVGALAAVFPISRTLRAKIVDGLRLAD